MNAKEAIKVMIGESGKSGIVVSDAIGRGRNYVYSLMYKKTDPALSTLTSIADVCGYDLTLQKRDGTERILIDPPIRE